MDSPSVVLLEQITDLLERHGIINNKKTVTKINLSIGELTKDFSIILTVLARNVREDDLT